MPTLDDYLALITSQHASKPNFVATVKAFVKPFIDAQRLLESLTDSFDLDTAVGVQLDAVGQKIGRTRIVDVPLSGVYFSFDLANVGFDQGYWLGPFDPITGITSLSDDIYRLLLRAKVTLNNWDGSAQVAAKALNQIFASFPNTIITLQDNGDMSMTVGISGQIPAAVLVSILEGGYLPINAAGVKVRYSATSVSGKPLFGFDSINKAVSGFDAGAWDGKIGLTAGNVTGFTLVSVGATTATFSWIAPDTGVGPFKYQGMYRVTGTQTFILFSSPVSTTQITFSNLAAGTSYDFQVYAINGAGAGLPCNPLTVTTTQGLPGQVTGLVATSATNTNVSLSWNTVLGTSIQYQTSYRLSGNTAWINFGNPVLTTNTTVTGLTINTVYDFRVIAQNSVGAGPASTILTTGTSGSVPGAVQNITSQSVTSTSFVVAWTPPLTNNGPYSYGVQIARNVAPITYQTIAPITPTTNGAYLTYTFASLIAGASYLVKIFATNGSGNGDAGATPLPVQLLISGPDQVSNVALGTVTTTSVTLTWAAASGAATYQPQYQVVGSTTWVPFGTPIALTSVTITGLNPATNYNFNIFAINSAGTTGAPSVTIAGATLGVLPSAPAIVSITNNTSTSFTVTWSAPTLGTTPFSYQPQYRIQTSSVWLNFGSPISALTTTITGLQSNTAYLVQILPSNSAGTGTPSASVGASTVTVTSSSVFDPTQKTANVVLTNTNKTASTATGGGANGVKSSVYYGTGKRVAEFTIVAATTSLTVGLASNPFSFIVSGYNTCICLGGTGSFIDTAGVNWFLNTTGQISMAGTPLTGISGAKKLVYTLGQVWYQASNGHWYYSDFATGSWLPTGGSTIPPVIPACTSGFQTNAASNFGVINSQGDVFSLLSTGYVAINGLSNINTANSALLTYISNIMYVKDTSGNWKYYDYTTSSWLVPTTSPVIPSTLSPPLGLGTDSLGIGLQVCNGSQNLLIGNTIISSGTGNSVAGDVVTIAVDLSNQLIWFTTKAMRTALGLSAWNNSPVANPATNSGGIYVAATADGLTYALAFGDSNGGASVTLNAGASSYTVALPTGFTVWDGTGVSVANVPTQPSNIQIGTVTNNSISTSWSASTNGPTNYQTQLRLTGTTDWYNAVLVGNSTSATIANLLSGTQYDVAVYAFNLAGKSVISSAVTTTTLPAGANPLLTYRGLNLSGADLTVIAGVKAAFPNSNAVIIPVWVSTATQSSTDVVITSLLTSVATWVQSAKNAGLQPFLAVYLSVRNGTPAQTITPSDPPAFFTNLQNVCIQIATVGATNNAIGMWCGANFHPWQGAASGDTGPFSNNYMSQWASIYTACKAVWNSGIISYAAPQSAIGLAAPNSPTSISWTFFDAVVFNIFPGSNNTYTTATAFQQFFDTKADPDSATQAATGNQPLFAALSQYASQVGKPIIINSCGIVPATGNQLNPANQSPVPPPYAYDMQTAWWTAIFYEINQYLPSILGIFCLDGGVNTYVSPYNGVDYYGLSQTAAGTAIDLAFSKLTGVANTLTAPTNFAVSSITTTTLVVSWSPLVTSGVVYIAQISPHGANSWTNLSATSGTTATFNNLLSASAYDMRVFAQLGSTNGPPSPVITATTGQATGVPAKRARDFTSICGIETQMKYQYQIGSASPYYNTANIKAILDYLNPLGIGTGVSVIRETVLDNRPYNIFLNWGAAGYKFCMGYNYPGVDNLATSQDQQTKINTMISNGYVKFVEGPNELNGFGPVVPSGNYTSPAGGTTTGVAAGASMQIDTYSFFKKTGVTIARYSIGDQTQGYGLNNNPIQKAITAAGHTLASVTDVGTVHSYTWGGYCPTDPTIHGTDQTWSFDAQAALNVGDTQALGLPSIATEVGLVNLSMPDQYKFGNSYVNSSYHPQLYLHCFKKGYQLVAIYEAANGGPDDGTDQTHYGLADVNGLPFGSLVSIHNLMYVVGDAGTTAATFTPTTLNYSIANLPSSADQVLLEKSNGDFLIVIWPNASIYFEGTYTAAAPVTLNVSLGATYSTVKVYDILQNTQNTNIIGNVNWLTNTPTPTPVQSLSNVSSVSPVMGDGPIVIVVSSATGGGGSALAAPTNVVISSPTISSLSVGWSAVTGSNISYIVQYRTHGTTSWTSLTTTNTSAIITGLAAGTQYDVEVVASGSINPTNVTSTSFTLSHPAVVTGAHTLTIADPSGSSETVTYSAVASGAKAIGFVNPVNVITGTSFTVSGTLSGYTAAPTLYYSDDGGTNVALPSSSSGKIPVPRPLPTATSGTWNTSGVFQGMPYAILMPYGYDATKYVYPLLVCLHSSGPMDNGVTNNSSTLISNVIQPEGFDIFNDNPNWTPYSTFWPGGARKNYPAIIVVPAVSGDSNYWGGYEANGPTASGQQVHDLVTSLMSSLSVDPARVYCMGFSYGGLGSYEQAYFWPDLYAGIVPMAGAPNSTLAIATWAAKLKTMPIWGIHCTADNTVSYSRDLLGYQALSQAAGLGLMQFTQVNQATWSPYGGDSHTSAEDEGMTKTVYWDWLFSQAKAGTTTSTPATVTTTSFSFTHPQVAAGNHTLSITDGTNSYKVTYTVAANSASNYIQVNPLIPITTGTAYTVTGKLGGYTSAPALTYADDSGVATVLPTGGSTVTSSPSAIISGTTLSSSGASPNNTVITISNGGSITDTYSQVWTISSTGVVNKNNTPDTITSGVTEMAYVNNVVWQFNGSLWWYWDQPTSLWLPNSGQATSPLPTGGILPPTNVSVSNVTTTSGTVSWTASTGTGITYIVQYSAHAANAWISLAATSAVTTTITGLTTGASYDVQIQAVQGTTTSAYTTIVTFATSSSSGTTTGYSLGTGPDASAMPRAQALWDMIGVDFEPKNIVEPTLDGNFALWFKMMMFLYNGGRGIYWIRDNLRQYDQASIDTWLPMAGAAGIRWTFDVDFDPAPATNSLVTSGTSQWNNWIKYKAYIKCIEGINEVQNFNVENASYRSVAGVVYGAVQSVVACQVDLASLHTSQGIPNIALFTLGNANSTASMPEVAAASNMGVKLLSLTLGGPKGTGIGGPVHVYADSGYPMGSPQHGREQGAVAANAALTGGYSGLPLFATEYGYCHGAPAGDYGQGNNFGSPWVNARYISQDMCHAFNEGFFGVHIYDLLDFGDNGPDPHWGRFDYLGNPLQDAYELRFHAGITGDTGANKSTFYPGRLPTGFSVTGMPTYGFTTTTQRSDGAVHIRLCPYRALYVNGSYTGGSNDLNSSNVTVNFGKTVGTVRIYDTATASDAYGGKNADCLISTNTNVATWVAAPVAPAPIQTFNNVSSVTVAVAGGMIIVEVAP